MDRVGMIAVANMGLLGACGLTIMWLIPPGGRPSDEPEWKETLGWAIQILVLILTFPLAWIFESGAGPHMPPVFAPLYIPINAYLWGLAGRATVTRWRRGGRLLFVFLYIVAIVAAVAIGLLVTNSFSGRNSGLVLAVPLGIVAAAVVFVSVRLAIPAKGR
jgi:4-amino-4-deoxy-L-arabinose transferase-like glycosyltransferase